MALQVLAIAAGILILSRISRCSDLDAFPTVGPSSLLGYCYDFRSLSKIIQEGYEKYKSAPFKIMDRYRWMVILSKREHLEELSKVPEDRLSFLGAVNDQINFHLTLGNEIREIPYHTPVIRFRLTRNIETLYPEIRDEIITAFDEVLNLEGSGDWKSLSASSVIERVVCRTSNRLLAGHLLSRNPDWIDLSIQSNFEIAKEGFLIGLFPEFLRPLAAYLFTGVARSVKLSLKYLGPIIEERLRYLNEYGNEWADSPNDLLSWLMEEAKGSQLTVTSLVTRVLFVNFGAIHTTSLSFTHTLFYLAAHPQYIYPLREEIESVVQKEGWSKAALGKMRKVDSFLRECQRTEGASIVSLTRKAMENFTFSDGTVIPKGTTIAAASRSLHFNGKFYEDADVFKPFRFAEIHEEDGEGAKHQFVSTSTEYLPFGHGKHACPGRFFAAIELKTMLAHLVMTYDIKLEDDRARPHSLHIGIGIIPNPRAKVLFRKRVD